MRAATVLIFVIIAALQSWRGCSTEQREPPQAMPEGRYHVLRVVDGDTLLMQDHKRLRLMGVDTPETVKEDTPVQPWGPEATQFTRDFVGRGDVRLQFDRERTDRFGRYLAYVFVGDRMLNEELLRAGLARWEPGYHYSQSMKTRFRKAQREAQQAHRGIWSEDKPHTESRNGRPTRLPGQGDL
jgi:micrococcal nuclease